MLMSQADNPVVQTSCITNITSLQMNEDKNYAHISTDPNGNSITIRVFGFVRYLSKVIPVPSSDPSC